MDEAKKVANDNFGSAKCKMPFAKDDETGDVLFKTRQPMGQPKFVDSQGTLIAPELTCHRFLAAASYAGERLSFFTHIQCRATASQ